MKTSAVWMIVLVIATSCAMRNQNNNVSNPSAAVRRALDSNNQAVSLEEWQESENHPDKWFEEILKGNDSTKISQLCEALAAKKNSDLALFEESLEHHAKELPCAADLLRRLSNHWVEKKIQFKPGIESADSSLPDGFTLPNKEMEIDAASGPRFSNGNLEKNQIALTFDDGPHPTRTAEILKILQEAGVRATFFEIGQNAHAYPQFSRQVVEEGHSLGSHSNTHPNLPKLSYSHAIAEIDSGYENVENAAGTIFPFFRFPYGSMSPSLRKYVAGRGWANFLWNMDSLDWKLRDPEALFKNVLAELDREKGGIILFHDIHEQTVIVLPRVLQELRDRGFETYVFVPRK